MAGFSLTHEERVALTFIAHSDPKDGFVRRTWLEFRTAICGLLQRTRENGWIRVEERLSERGTPVLAHTENGNIYVASRVQMDDDASRSQMDDDGEWLCEYGGIWVFPNVTHWMPLPAPPEVK